MKMLERPQGCRLAYERIEGAGPGIVFLTGFKSDMTGDKATRLEAFARQRGRAFLRFDYSGHGASEGRFEDGTIGTWAEDARAAVETLTEGPQILVGSSMGGWIALLLARDMGARVGGLVTIAAAPDFTEDGYWAGWSEEERARLMAEGSVSVPSDYGEPYVITRALIEDGRERLVLRSPLRLPMPVRCLLGTADEAVPLDWGLRLLEHAEAPDMRLTLVKGVDHRFSTPECLALIEASVEEVSRGL
jgi:pimeloyl-ACP methyl ester carboxylesterase